MVKLLKVIKKFLLLLGILVLVSVLGSALTVASALWGEAPKCPEGPGVARSEAELNRLLQGKGLTVKDAEATALIQKSLSEKVVDPRICFTIELLHLSGKFKLGSISPSFYVSAGIDVAGETPQTKNLDIRIGNVPNLFIFTPIEKMIEGMLNDNLSQMKISEKFSVKFSQGEATIKRVQ